MVIFSVPQMSSNMKSSAYGRLFTAVSRGEIHAAEGNLRSTGLVSRQVPFRLGRAFTLIELLVVIAIIAILAAMLLCAFPA